MRIEKGMLVMTVLRMVSLGSSWAGAELKPLNDQALSNVTGQAFVQVDQYDNPNNSNIELCAHHIRGRYFSPDQC